jgi:uncharacterized protein (PEP-CTERM system associated)
MGTKKRVTVRVRPECFGPMCWRAALPVVIPCVAGGVWASSALAEPAFRIDPSISTRLTYTDNAHQSSNANSDFIFEVAPTIRVSRLAGRLTGALDASLRNVVYMDEGDRNTSFIAFQGKGQYEAIENMVFVEASGSVSRNDRSLFSGRSSTDDLNTDAANETRTFTVSPRMVFHFGNTANGQIRLDNRWTSGGSASLGDRYTRTLTGNASDGAAFGPLGWFADYSRVDTEYSDTDQNVFRQNVRLGASYNATSQLVLRVSVGREQNDYTSGGTEGKTTHGFGFDWTPTPRTQFSAFTEERIFGRGYDISFNHRRALSNWRLSYSKDFSSSDELISGDLQDAYFEAYFGSLQGLGLTQAQQDAIKQQLLAQAGLLITNAQYVLKNLQADVSFVGKRNVLSLALYRRARTRLANDLTASAIDDFANFSEVRDSGGSVSLRHDLTPRSALNTSLSLAKVVGEGTTNQDIRRKTLSVGLTRRLGAKATGSLDYRHLQAKGTTDYTENRLTATLGLRF